jgi:hypothetical protein
VSRVLVLILLVAFLLALIALGLAYWRPARFESISASSAGIFDPARATPIVAAAIQEFSSSSALALALSSTTIPLKIVSGTVIRSNGLAFTAPWTNPPNEKTSSPNSLFTLFDFGHGEIVETFSSSVSLSPIADRAEAAFLKGLDQEHPGTAALIKSANSSDFDSNFDFIRASLNSTPEDLIASSTPSKTVLAATAFLPVKTTLFQFLSADFLPVTRVAKIYSFVTPIVRGFEFDGSFTAGTTTYAVSHLLVFGSNDRAHDLLVQGATGSEIDILLSSLGLETASR